MSYESVVKEDSPKLYYRLGESSGTSAADASGNSLAGTYKNAPTLGAAGALGGDANTAITLNGTNQFIERAHNALLNVADVFTFEAWVKRSENGRQDVVLYKESATNKSAKLAITTANKVQLRIPGVKTLAESTTEVKADGNWHHVVATKNGATVKIYVDGVDVTGAVTNETCKNNEGTLCVGSENPTEEFLKGSLDEVAYYSTALSEARVKAHFSAGSTSPTTVPLGASAGSSTTSLALRTPTMVQLGSSAGSGATSLELRVPTQVLLGPSPGTSSTAISLRALLVLALGPSGGTSTPSLTLSGRTQIPLGSAGGQGGAALSLQAKASLTLISGGQANAALAVGVPILPYRIQVAERPPMRQYILATAPNGRTERWGEDELEAAKVISDLTSSSSAPGGCKDFSAALPRKPGIDYSDMKPGSRIEEFGAGQRKVGEYRLERTPRTSGDYLVMEPAASGYQVLLSDNEGAREIFLDSETGGWREPSTQRRLNLGEAHPPDAAMTAGWRGTGEQPPGITFDWQGIITREHKSDRGEAWYDGGGVSLGALLYHFVNLIGSGNAEVWETRAHLCTDDVASQHIDGVEHDGFTNSNAFERLNAETDGYRFALLKSDRNESGAGGVNLPDLQSWQYPKILGRHGLPLRGSWPEVGLLASDVIPYLLSYFAPNLYYTTGTYGTIKPSNFVIPHLVFKEPTTVLDMLTTILSFELLEWGVWPGQFGPTFYLNQRGQREGSKRWRTRIRPAKFTETGQQMDQGWNRVVMSWTDFDGTLKTMGPPGSGYPLTDARCEDADPQNLINQAGAIRTKHLTVNGPGTVEGAAEKARLFLERSKLLDGSGEATLTGYVEDEHGTEWPYYCVDATDKIEFINSSIKGYRYIVEAEPERSSRSVKVKIDAPPDSYEALLAELQVRETAASL